MYTLIKEIFSDGKMTELGFSQIPSFFHRIKLSIR